MQNVFFKPTIEDDTKILQSLYAQLHFEESNPVEDPEITESMKVALGFDTVPVVNVQEKMVSSLRWSINKKIDQMILTHGLELWEIMELAFPEGE